MACREPIENKEIVIMWPVGFAALSIFKGGGVSVAQIFYLFIFIYFFQKISPQNSRMKALVTIILF